MHYASALLHGPGAEGRSHRRSEEHTSELQSQSNLVCRLLLEKKNDDLHVLVIALDVLQELRSLLARELEVQGHQIDRLLFQELECGLCAVHRIQVVEGSED